MASLDFEVEKTRFRERYESSRHLVEGAVSSFRALINALVGHDSDISISKIEARIKEREECIQKFNLKYRTALETKSLHYEIWDHISDIVGVRVVCLYEDDVEKVRALLSNHFEVVDVTDKIAQMENTEASFGYKGLHLDLKLGSSRRSLPEYSAYSGIGFEVQIRTIIQDSWSVLDHKIKYKKSIPNPLKRRINTLAALFELADREFREIRESTQEEIRKAQYIPVNEASGEQEPEDGAVGDELQRKQTFLDAFSFLRIAGHFFRDYAFEARKIDGFTDEIVTLDPEITRGQFNSHLRQNIARVKRYQQDFEARNTANELNPYTVMRHCLYLADGDMFLTVLNKVAREAFDAWLAEHPTQGR